ncbi:signal peptide peptidase SppA [Paenisporosarcina sp. FSL H8-0542]|uniref:signal peptide peptidase SppA n=1 Tax=unclassified Paenisporosarcina TaxID=2642018 RepID=UPI00034EA809|nr:signal peptide peptidase SppA [Paenisporosarcina sp. HGH0030]EPD54144.1 signal peptide peptidase SppA, 36K type [Paenisporosarcina sp. HGH0030]
MNAKRWIALGAAALLLGLSTIINMAFFAFSNDWTSNFENMLALPESEYSESVLEVGDTSKRIAVLTVDGVIQDTGEATSLFGTAGYDHQFFMDQLEMIKEDDTIKAVVLQVNSPGGGVVESAQIYDKIKEVQEEVGIPFYVSMGSMAASGGYYISAPADKIFLNKETLTGSIGVIMESVNYGKLAEKYGVDFVTIKTGPYKDIMSPTRDMTEDERAMLQDMINESYESFVDIIEEGRGMTEAEVKKVADGRIMNGRQAIEAGLADEYGYLEDVIEAVRKDFDLEDAEVIQYEYPQGFSSLFSMKAQSLLGGDAESQLIGRLLSDYNAPRMMYLYGEK